MDLPLEAPDGVRRSGSVKRARERMEMERLQREAAESQDAIESPPRARRPSDRLRQPPQPSTTASRSGQGLGPAIARPAPTPQWPINATSENLEFNDGFHQQYQPPAGRGKPPQRPPRPSNVPSMLDAPQLQEYAPSFQYEPNLGTSRSGSQSKEAQHHLEELTPPNALYQMTTASRASTASSAEIITDFPAPTNEQGRGVTALGPPPSARRGPSSYYSVQSFVSPIPEESSRTQTSRSSYASSGAIPANWGNMPYGSANNSSTHLDSDMMEDDRELEGEGIVRSASLGKRAKPSMIKTKKLEKPDGSQGVLGKTRDLVKMGVIEPPADKVTPQKFQDVVKTTNVTPMPTMVHPAPRDATWPTFGGLDSPIEGNKELDYMMTSSSDSDSSFSPSLKAIEMEKLPPIATLPAAREAFKGPSGFPLEKDEKEIQYSRTSAIRRPPRLNMDALRDAEARGSLTSLPDLILRATKLASMMGEGKRPASRLNNLNDFESSSRERSEKGSHPLHHSTASGLSGMLAAFPPPGLATPLGTPKSETHWRTRDESSTKGLNTPRDGQARRKGRRCCGMPLWCFIMFILFILVVIAAAVVVPLEFLVLNKPAKETSTLSALQICQRDAACENGGTSILNGSSCSCICANGYTGTSCTKKTSASCSKISFKGASTTYSDVTLGSAIPRLIVGADSNYSIPLSYEPILSQFSAAALSCDAENALVTFNGKSSRRDGEASSSSSITGSPSVATRAPIHRRHVGDFHKPHLHRRIDSVSVSPSILVATSAQQTPAPTTTVASAPQTSGASNFAVTEETLDFARVVVLYVLQTRTLEDAANAQTKIRAFLSSGKVNGYSGASNVSIGSGMSIDFTTWNVDVGMGAVGGRAKDGVRWMKREAAIDERSIGKDLDGAKGGEPWGGKRRFGTRLGSRNNKH